MRTLLPTARSNAKLIPVLVSLALLLFGALSLSAQVIKKRPDPPKPPAAQTSGVKTGAVEFGPRESSPEIGGQAPFQLTGEELYYRAEFGWGYRINLDGFTDISARGPKSRDLLGFAYRSDSAGVTLAHLYIHQMTEEFDGQPISEVFELYSKRALEDTTIIPESVTKRIIGPLYTLEYARSEVWPMKDPNDPGEMFDSTLVRRHSYAIAVREGSWLNIHLSKTEMQEEDSLMFVDLLKTVTFEEKVPAFPIIRTPASDFGNPPPPKEE